MAGGLADEGGNTLAEQVRLRGLARIEQMHRAPLAILFAQQEGQVAVAQAVLAQVLAAAGDQHHVHALEGVQGVRGGQRHIEHRGKRGGRGIAFGALRLGVCGQRSAQQYRAQQGRGKALAQGSEGYIHVTQSPAAPAAAAS
jgi:hypothetical protein